jgi:CRISPR/Cas system-associated exonuclease Cas4 (RecB family)
VTTALTTADLLLLWDQRRPRSQQAELGMSELGGCRRRVGYRLAGTPPSNAGGSVQAVMGTAIHAAVETVFRELQADGVLPAEDLIEHQVSFAGILGHVDRYEPGTATVEDTKTTSARWLEHIKVHGPDRSHRWQVASYAAALIHEGRRVRRVVINYLARDTGEEWRWEAPFDPAVVREALAWLAEVRATELEMLPRDYLPDSAFCAHCPFAVTCWDGAVEGRAKGSVLYVEDPDAAKWAQELWDAREAKKEAEEKEARAKAALDALRPNDIGTAVVDVGWRMPLQWQVITSNRLDAKAVRAEYKKTGAEPPMTSSTSVKLAFAPADDEKPPAPAAPPPAPTPPAAKPQTTKRTPAPVDPGGPATTTQTKRVTSGLVLAGFGTREAQAALLASEVGRPVEAAADLTAGEATALLDKIKRGDVRPAAGSSQDGAA